MQESAPTRAAREGFANQEEASERKSGSKRKQKGSPAKEKGKKTKAFSFRQSGLFKGLRANPNKNFFHARSALPDVPPPSFRPPEAPGPLVSTRPREGLKAAAALGAPGAPRSSDGEDHNMASDYLKEIVADKLIPRKCRRAPPDSRLLTPAAREAGRPLAPPAAQLRLHTRGAQSKSANLGETPCVAAIALAAQGFAIPRFTNDDVFRNLDGVLETIRARLN